MSAEDKKLATAFHEVLSSEAGVKAAAAINEYTRCVIREGEAREALWQDLLERQSLNSSQL